MNRTKKNYKNCKTYQIERFIMANIKNNTYMVGKKIPTEKDFCEMFGVSRMTVNRAIQSIVAKGLLTTRRGFGTVVNDIAMDKEITQLTSFSEDLIRQGMTPVTSLLEFTSSSRNMTFFQDKFGVPKNTVIHKFLRKRSDSDDPVAVDTTYINSQVISTIDVSYLEGSFYEYLENQLEIRISHSYFELDPLIATDEHVELLDVEKGTPLICQKHITYTVDNVPFEYVETIYNPKKFKFSGVSYRNREE